MIGQWIFGVPNIYKPTVIFKVVSPQLKMGYNPTN